MKRRGVATAEELFLTDEFHPINVAETIALHREWEFDRMGDEHIAIAIDGQWRSYALSLIWFAQDEMLRLICSFDIDPPSKRHAILYETINACNDRVWNGAFTFLAKEKMMVWRCGVLLSESSTIGTHHIDKLISDSIIAAERFYPAFQLVAWGDKTPTEAMGVAMSEAYGHA